jgi:hypothetical protein
VEEGLQSAWLYETLSPHVDEIVVAGIAQSRGPKSDKRDAYGLAEKLRVGNLDKYVFKAPRRFTRLREFSRTQMKRKPSPSSKTISAFTDIRSSSRNSSKAKAKESSRSTTEESQEPSSHTDVSERSRPKAVSASYPKASK